MRIVQASVAKRLAFAKWARLAGLNRHSSATWKVPDDVDIPDNLLAGAQVNGKPYQDPKASKPAPKRTRVRVRKDIGPVEEPIAPQPELEATSGGTVTTSSGQGFGGGRTTVQTNPKPDTQEDD